MRLLLYFSLAFLLLAEPPIATMKESTLVIVVETPNGGGNGSGFVIGDKLAVTNWHVCCRDENTKVWILKDGRQRIAARVVWQAKAKDLAVIEAETPLGKPKVRFSTRAQLRDAQAVWAIGYPGASNRKSNTDGSFSATITQGIISKFFQSAPGEQLSAERMIQTTAAANPGNSGGPLFDDCGRVIGINTAKALVGVMTADGRVERVPLADGINWAIESQELLDQLKAMNIPFDVAAEKCGAASAEGGSSSMPAWMVGAQMGTVVLALAGVGLGLRKRRQEQARHTASLRAAVPVLRGVSGFYAGQALPLDAKPLVLGRDPQTAQLVYPVQMTEISNRHCQVRVEMGKVWLEDLGSSNGTFLSSGKACVPGQRVALHNGDRFYLSTPANSFEVG